MQPSILSIGNATNDSYLQIQDKENIFSDEKNVFHFDLAFDDSALEYKKIAGVFGGVVLSDKIFRAAHLKSFSDANPQGFANFSPEKSEFPSIIRYIITHDSSSFVLNGSNKSAKWFDPVYVSDAIYIAENGFSDEYLKDFENYIEKHKEVKIIFSLDDFADNTELARKLLQRSKLVFLDVDNVVDIPEIDHSSAEKLVDSLKKLGAENIALSVGGQMIAANKTKISQISVQFGLNSFYQASIFRAAFAAEILLNHDLENSLKLASSISSQSDFEDIIKPLIAEQFISRNKKEFEVKLLRHKPNLREKIHSTASALVTRPKGIFAADESGGNIHKKFEIAGIEDSAENRRRYREMFFETPDIQNYLSGVILFEETAAQKNSKGESFVNYLKNRGILTGIKLDEGLAPMLGFDGETITKGLDSLDDKLAKYAEQGIDFAKWRVAFDIDQGDDLPSNAAIASNVQILARYAKACQAYGIVPIVEPEVIYAGNHSLEQCKNATKRILYSLFEELKLFEVDLAGTILKTNMVLSGKENAHNSSASEAAEATISALKETVPGELAGIVFLSGGQTVHQATDNLQAITNIGPFEWNITYSYARALQSPALKAWAGKDANLRQAQLIFLERVAANSHALYKN